MSCFQSVYSGRRVCGLCGCDGGGAQRGLSRPLAVLAAPCVWMASMAATSGAVRVVPLVPLVLTATEAEE